MQAPMGAMNPLYASFIPADRLPAGTTVGAAGLARDSLLKIDLIAARP